MAVWQPQLKSDPDGYHGSKMPLGDTIVATARRAAAGNGPARRDEIYARLSEFHLRGMTIETCGAASSMVATYEIFQENDPFFHPTPIIYYPWT